MSAIDPATIERGAGPIAPQVAVRFAPRASAPLRGLGVLGLLLAVPLIALVTLWPSHLLLRIKPRVVRGLEWLHARELFDWLSWTRLEVLANVAMFVPLALVLVFALGARRWWLALALCLAATVGVELAQHAMPGRVASLQDVVANGLGAVVGVCVAAAAEALVRRARLRSLARQVAASR